MRCDDVWVVSVAAELGRLVPVADAVAAGQYDAEVARRSGMISSSIADGPGIEMVTRCGAAALDAAPEVPRSHVHASGLPQGPPMWSVAPYLWGRLRPGDRTGFAGLSTSVSAACAGSTVALENAIRSVAVGTGPVLVTAVDTFGDPADYGPGSPAALDRYRSDHGLILGDAAAAAVIGTGGGLFRVAAVSGYTVPALEVLQRGDDRPDPQLWPPAAPISQRTRTAFASGMLTGEQARQLQHRGVQGAVFAVLRDAQWGIDSVRCFALPFVAPSVVSVGYLQPLTLTPDRTLAELGSRTGHLGAVDHLVALDHLCRSRLIRRGDRVVLLGVGSGFTFVAIALEATDLAGERTGRRRRRTVHTITDEDVT
ncbi:3-oxoacyl-[acyl-carrier-protein] synthase III C-terminal domain-containing protein [Williamsia sp. CHRR-6]|uniref:3-oxoacyl-[acyl-carrier-protein] synthase III C-terminal domain-containing protein n=1 Tax=Williamsia sp. CHRR-6 TaxID=2835871 RepID=UPI001BDB085D|nr:3-oxoacyl-[acyl-carrier-protein] synthase III C-terminal domain-containing protein [Williamsia sp. CHRR-6]MBT0565849.1 hypothetical protein [Williamsia sp. CHRR-6]